jgi:type I restriction enzyme S subunit
MTFPHYANYENSGVEWLGNLPSHWQQKWLGILASPSNSAFVDGPFGSDLKSSDYQDAGVPLIQLNNIRGGKHLLRNMKFISDKKRSELSRHSAVPGDMVIAKMADPVARSAVVSDQFDEYVIVADCVKMTPDVDRISLSFLVWTMNSDCVRISAELASSGVTRVRINLGQIKKLRIPYPPLIEQTQIARFLDHETAKIDNLIHEQKRLIELLHEKRQAVISHAVTKGLDPSVPMKDSGVEWLGEVPAHWACTKLGLLAFMQEGPGLRHWQFADQGVRVICVTNITAEGIDFSKLEKFISEEEYQRSYRHFTVNSGDILLSSSGNSWGKVARYTSEEQLILNTSTIRLNELKHGRLKREYLRWFLESKSCREQLGVAMTGSCQPNFGPTHLNEVLTACPPVGEQVSIAHYLDSIITDFLELIESSEVTVNYLQERRSALISAAVTGKIDVRNWQPPADESAFDKEVRQAGMEAAV